MVILTTDEHHNNIALFSNQHRHSSSCKQMRICFRAYHGSGKPSFTAKDGKLESAKTFNCRWPDFVSSSSARDTFQVSRVHDTQIFSSSHSDSRKSEHLAFTCLPSP
ncbi:hypothetical protein Cob_v005113 [Colletotrichum orbiculare MAFF 240422]|uniref:Uncharacterized protein n=1 Tax=Colletotrichum orbiculare (strain 104-T / ATCC 96160 / CBS 514.97 / LARS 414 / MAFF 240422) TaxID=1213857 RepID=A0A484FWS8_COLOR|nr:hypothetical protein Cob_v005113 [Colletotrichum orbiculare MAFF 240422]